ncbi:MAG: hypothetical protein RIR10_18 [Planctomycetota bacterium]
MQEEGTTTQNDCNMPRIASKSIKRTSVKNNFNSLPIFLTYIHELHVFTPDEQH